MIIVTAFGTVLRLLSIGEVEEFNTRSHLLLRMDVGRATLCLQFVAAS